MITKEYAEGLTEVLIILDNTETEYVKKIPEKIMNLFKENASKDYVPNINTNQEIKDMNLLKETKQILSAIYMNYWAGSEEEKKAFEQTLKGNQKLVDEEAREKYNPDNVFENSQKIAVKPVQETVSNNSVKEEEALVEYKPNFFQRIISKIKDFISGFKK